MSLRTRGILFSVVGLAGFAAALLAAHLQFLGVGVGFVFLFLAGTAFSNAAQLARSLVSWVKKSVNVEVWGIPLPASSGEIFEVDSIAAFGAGLLIRLHAASGGARTLLKVAQPASSRFDEGQVVIGQAAYVSWAGRKLKPAGGTKMPALVLRIGPPTILPSPTAT